MAEAVFCMPGVIEVLMYQLGGPFCCTDLRATSRAFRDAIQRPSPAPIRPNDLLILATKEGNIPLCILARSKGATCNNNMLYYAASGGHEHICRLAKQWGATDYNNMLYNAASGCHEHLCFLAKQWGATDYNGMFRAAIRHEHIRILAKQWGAII